MQKHVAQAKQWIRRFLGVGVHLMFLLLYVPWALPAANDPVSIPDANLRAALETKLAKSPGDTITEAEMATITSLGVTTEVSDLTGLEYATSVTSLRFQHQENAILDLSPLRNLTQLTVLNIWHKDLTNISPLENLTALTDLTLWRRNTTDPSVFLDLTPLADLSNLTYLFLRGNVEDISPLRGLTGLTNLILDENSIVDISPLQNLEALKQLQLGYNEITDISPLRDLTDLEELVLRDNVNLSNISVLRYLTKLELLWLMTTSIMPSGLGQVLPFLGSLENLNLQLTRISDLSVLDQLPADASLASLDLRLIGQGVDTGRLLRDLTPLVGFVRAGKMGTALAYPNSPLIKLQWNIELDYESIYTDLPALMGVLGESQVQYQRSEPELHVEDQVGHPRTRYTFKVQAFNFTPVGSVRYENSSFENVPVTFTVTAPNGTQTQTQTLTDPDGFAPVSLTLGAHGEVHTVTAVVPAMTTSVANIRHDELRESFTVTADRTVPPPASGSAPRGSGGPFSALSFPGEIGFSELMFTAEGGTTSLPQWIELCNASQTETVNLHGWQLDVEGRDAEGAPWQETLTLNALPIPPGETALLVTSDAPNTVALPEKRVYNLFEHHPEQLKQDIPTHRNRALGETGFSLKLSDPYGAVSDVAGNLDGDGLTADEPMWTLPPGSTAEGFRASVFRLYDAVEKTPLDGRLSTNWISAAEVRVFVRTYWGAETDRGNPGHKAGWAFPLRHLSFSEVMLTSKGGLHSLPQWIELYNASQTAIDLKGWTLKIESRDAAGEHRHGVIPLQSFVIPPGKLGLIASSRGQSYLPERRVYMLDDRDAEGISPNSHRNRNKVLGQVGFFLKLLDPDGAVIDLAGNLDGQAATADKPKWELPNGRTADGERTSLTRRYYRGAAVPLDGKRPENWERTVELPVKVSTYYGRRADISTPGHTGADGRPPGRVSFSELMLTSRGGLHSLPQWIELYNASQTAIDLRGWTLKIEARDAAGKHRYGAITLERFVLPPGQTGLIVTWHGNTSREISRDRVYTLYHARAFERNKVLGQHGFFLELSETGRSATPLATLTGIRGLRMNRHGHSQMAQRQRVPEHRWCAATTKSVCPWQATQPTVGNGQPTSR